MSTSNQHLSPQQIAGVLGSLSMFAGIHAKQLEPFVTAAQQRQLTKGAVLYSEGDDATHFHVLLTGWLKLSHTTLDGNEMVLGVHSRGEVLGEYALFEDCTYKNSAQAVEKASMLSIPISLLDKQMELVPRIMRNLLVGMVKCQRRHELQAIQHLLYGAAERIGGFILGRVNTKPQQDGVTITLPYDKTLLAATLGMRGATFSRGLQTLRSETGIEIQGNKVTIRSMKRLRDFAGACYSQIYPVEKKSCLT